MLRPERDDLEDEQVERALRQTDPLVSHSTLLCHFDRKRSTCRVERKGSVPPLGKLAF